MTIAIDKATGKVCGQVVHPIPAPMWTTQEPASVRLLTKNGTVEVPRDSVRLEEIETR
jgi:hypothetical protein